MVDGKGSTTSWTDAGLDVDFSSLLVGIGSWVRTRWVGALDDIKTSKKAATTTTTTRLSGRKTHSLELPSVHELSSESRGDA